LAATPTAGTVPPQISNAPPLPDISGFNPANYPPLDKVPDVNSPEVQQWVSEVMNSGIPIPNITQTVPGGCPANLQAAADTSRCWWTCGGCTRPTDIEACPEKMHWGLTYDDGPAFYTSQLLDYLDEKQLKSTFFCVGSRVASFPNTLRQEYISGHQVAVHTWSHPSLTTLSNEQIIAELGWTKKVMKDVLGVTPNMMRPPFGDIDDRVRAISLAMGLIPTMWTRISPTATFDTNDFNIQGGLTSAAQVLQNWENIMNNATTISTGFIVLEHDLFQDSVDIATGYILPDALARGGLTIEPIAVCVDRGLSNSYIETNDNKTFPPPQGSGALNSNTTSSGGSGGSSSDNNGASGSLHIGSGVVAFTILAGILANVLTVL
jgi:peptidoglycan/xylan/chitin deacetylase (PgdA/CDA1 family)